MTKQRKLLGHADETTINIFATLLPPLKPHTYQVVDDQLDQGTFAVKANNVDLLSAAEKTA